MLLLRHCMLLSSKTDTILPRNAVRDKHRCIIILLSILELHTVFFLERDGVFDLEGYTALFTALISHVDSFFIYSELICLNNISSLWYVADCAIKARKEELFIQTLEEKYKEREYSNDELFRWIIHCRDWKKALFY